MMPLGTEEARLSTEESILSTEAVDFLCALQRRFSSCRQQLLTERDRCQREFDLGNIPDPLHRVSRQHRNRPGNQAASFGSRVRAGDARRPTGARGSLTRLRLRR